MLYFFCFFFNKSQSLRKLNIIVPHEDKEKQKQKIALQLNTALNYRLIGSNNLDVNKTKNYLL